MSSLNILHDNKQRNIICHWASSMFQPLWISLFKSHPPRLCCLLLVKGGGEGVLFLCVRLSAHAHLCVSQGVRVLLINARLHVFYVLVWFSPFFSSPSLPFIHVCKTEMSCYGDWDTWVKRKWQNREMWLSGDRTMRLKEWDWKVCLHHCVRVNSRFGFYQQVITWIFLLFIIKANS